MDLAGGVPAHGGGRSLGQEPFGGLRGASGGAVRGRGGSATDPPRGFETLGQRPAKTFEETGAAAGGAVDRERTARRRRPRTGAVVSADERARDDRYGHHRPLVLLALADRNLFQAAQGSGAADRALAARV